MTRLPSWVKLFGGFLLAAVVVPLVYAGIQKVVVYDPFARYFGRWAEPFGKNIGSVMEKVDVTVYDGSKKTLSFHANRLDIRRDKQHMQLQLLSNGKVYDHGSPTAEFDAGLASYNVLEEKVDIAGGAGLRSKDYDFKATALGINRKTSTINVPGGVTGKFRKGDISAATLLLNFGGGKSVATNVLWKGPLQDTKRTVQIRAERSEFTSKPDTEVYYNAEVSDGDSLMRSRKVTWDKEKDIITLDGQCEYYGTEAVMTAPKVVVVRKEKRVVATGDVQFVVKPQKEKGITGGLPPAQPVLPPGLKQPETQGKLEDEIRSGKNSRKYPVVVTCTRAEYFYAKDKRHAILTGSPKARQEMSAGAWREMSAPKALYDEEKDLLTLLSAPGGRDVKMSNSLGDKLTAETLEISTKEGEERMTGTHIEGIMKVKEEEIGKEKGGGGGKT